MKNFVLILLVFQSFQVFTQNKQIDSLYQEIKILENKIQILKSEIQSEILKNGYYLDLEKNYVFLEVKLRESNYGKILDTINEGDRIKIIDREISAFKIEYDGRIGFIDISELKVDNHPSLKFLDYSYSRNTTVPETPTNSSSDSYNSSKKSKKTLDYSKPIKVKGHYRTTKSGKRVYVRPHTRKRKGS